MQMEECKYTSSSDESDNGFDNESDNDKSND